MIGAVSDVLRPEGTGGIEATFRSWHAAAVSLYVSSSARDKITVSRMHSSWEDGLLRTFIGDFIIPLRVKTTTTPKNPDTYRRARPGDIAIMKRMLSRLAPDIPHLSEFESVSQTEKEIWLAFSQRN